ncbi:MAG: hypothetical protein ACJAR0_003234 [Candidatus Azotimanducaceae bacterium]|jgi:hypothetical protein
MTDTRSASCACGKVEIQIEGLPAVMAYCHCDSCRTWLGAPLHAASLWATEGVTVVKGESSLDMFKITDDSLRHFCIQCGGPVLIRHPKLNLTDVPAGNIKGLKFEPSIHVNYAERVVDLRDGLPKFAAMPDAEGNGLLLEE